MYLLLNLRFKLAWGCLACKTCQLERLTVSKSIISAKKRILLSRRGLIIASTAELRFDKIESDLVLCSQTMSVEPTGLLQRMADDGESAIVKNVAI